MAPAAGVVADDEAPAFAWDRPRSLMVAPELPFIDEALPERLSAPLKEYVIRLTENVDTEAYELIDRLLQSLDETTIGEVCVSFSPSEDTNGNLLGVLHFSRDLTHLRASVGIFALGPQEGFSALEGSSAEPGIFKNLSQGELSPGFWSITMDGLGSGCS
jgi:hypothetical protein